MANKFDLALQEALGTIKQIDTAFSDVDKNILNAVRNLKKISKVDFDGASMKELNTRLKKSADHQQEVNAELKEHQRLEKALISTLAKKAAATESTNKELQKARVETSILNKEQKESAILSSNLTGEYKKQSTILNQLRRKYKDLVLSQGASSDEAKKLHKEVTQLDKKLKDVDASVGQHQRNVGNYSSALGNLVPGLDRVEMGLEGMGSSLDDISKSKNPFGDLITGAKNLGRAFMSFILSPVGLAITAIGALFMLIKGNKDTVLKFDSQLRDVGKTTGLAGKELEGLGNNIIRLSRKLKTVGTPQLLEYATVAGQLGVKGSKNILAFAEGLAKLETASDISGEEGAAQIARLLTLTDGGVENIKDFGDEIVVLGNNFAATEKEIQGNATAIAQNTAVYKFGRRDALAYATATKAVGVEAELTGSTIGRTLGLMEKSLRTGKNVQVLSDLTGKSVEELKSQFETNAAGTFTEFVSGLNAIDRAGGSVNEQLEKIGITSVRDQRVLGSLATGGFETLQNAIEKVTDAAGKMDEEFTAASQKLDNQLSRIGIAWDNLILSIENGQGAIGKVFAWLAGEAASYLEKWTIAINVSSALWGGLTNMLFQVKKEFISLLEVASKAIDIIINPVDAIRKMGKEGLMAFVADAKKQLTEGAGNIGNAFKEGFEGTIEKISAENAIKKALEEANEITEKEVPLGLRNKEGSIAAIQASISALEEQRDKLATTTEEVRQYNAAISQLQDKIDELQGKIKNSDISITPGKIAPLATPGISAPTDTMDLEQHLFEKKEKAKTAILEEEEEARRALIANSMRQFADMYGIDFSAFENLITKKTELTKGDWVDAAASAASTIVQLTKSSYNEELNIARENMNRILDSEHATEKQREEARKEFAKKEKEIRIKRAEDEKKAMIFQIAINTAAAIAKALPNVALSILAGALGAAQLAFVASRPVPKYKHGRKNGKAELAITGDGGVEEVITDSKGNFKAITPNKPTLTPLAFGDRVIPNVNEYLNSLNLDDLNRAAIMTSVNAQNSQLTEKQVQQNLNKEILQAIVDGNNKKQQAPPAPDYGRLAREFAKEMNFTRKRDV